MILSGGSITMSKKEKDKNKDIVIIQDGVEVFKGKWKNKEDKIEKLQDKMDSKEMKKLLKNKLGEI